MKVELASEAVADLAALVEYLHQRHSQAAATTADGIFSVIDQLAAREFEGPECELRRTRERVRSWQRATVPDLLPTGGRHARRVAGLSLGPPADSTVAARGNSLPKPKRFFAPPEATGSCWSTTSRRLHSSPSQPAAVSGRSATSLRRAAPVGPAGMVSAEKPKLPPVRLFRALLVDPGGS